MGKSAVFHGKMDADWGDLVNIRIEVTPEQAADLLKAGLPVPAPITAVGLLDSGASTTMFDETIAPMMGLPAIGTSGYLAGGGGGAVIPSNYYSAIITCMDEPMISTPLKVIGEIIGQKGLPFQVLLGRDFLQHFGYTHDGPGKTFELWKV